MARPSDPIDPAKWRAKVTSNELYVHPYRHEVIPDTLNAIGDIERINGEFLIRASELGGKGEVREMNEDALFRRFRNYLDRKYTHDAVLTDIYVMENGINFGSHIARNPNRKEIISDIIQHYPNTPLSDLVQKDAFAQVGPEDGLYLLEKSASLVRRAFPGVQEQAALHDSLAQYLNGHLKDYDRAKYLKATIEDDWRRGLPKGRAADRLAARLAEEMIEGKPIEPAEWRALTDEVKHREIEHLQNNLGNARKQLEHYGQERSTNPYAARLSDGAARQWLQRAVNDMTRLDHEKAQKFLERDDVTVVIIHGANVANFVPEAKKGIGGFWRPNDRTIYASTLEAATVLRHEIEHATIESIYDKNASRPFPESSGDTEIYTRKALFNEALRADLARIRPGYEQCLPGAQDWLQNPPEEKGKEYEKERKKVNKFKKSAGKRAMGRLRRDLGFGNRDLYPSNDLAAVEFIPYINDYKAIGKWDGALADRYFCLNYYIDQVYERDVEAYLQGKPLPPIDIPRLRAGMKAAYAERKFNHPTKVLPEYPAQVDYLRTLKGAPHFFSEEGDLQFPIELMDAKQVAKVEDALRRLGIPRASYDGQKFGEGYVTAEDEDLRYLIRFHTQRDSDERRYSRFRRSAPPPERENAEGFVLKVPAAVLEHNPHVKQAVEPCRFRGENHLVTRLPFSRFRQAAMEQVERWPVFRRPDGNFCIAMDKSLLPVRGYEKIETTLAAQGLLGAQEKPVLETYPPLAKELQPFSASAAEPSGIVLVIDAQRAQEANPQFYAALQRAAAPSLKEMVRKKHALSSQEARHGHEARKWVSGRLAENRALREKQEHEKQPEPTHEEPNWRDAVSREEHGWERG